VFEYQILDGPAPQVRFVGSPLHARNTFALEQYRYSGPECTIAAETGGIVLDGGACWGDSALYFGKLVGESGQVVAIEADAENVDTLHQNLVLNPDLASRVAVRQAALWRASGATVGQTGQGPAARLATESAGSVPTLSIDDVSRETGPPTFIKLDIEGSEPDALEGARKTLTSARPTLAVAAYHEPEHLWELLLQIRAIEPTYRFYLDHFTPYLEETILFASVRER
jgi:FkbM family methyltransferase